MPDAFEIREMTREDYVALVIEKRGLPDGAIIMDEDGFMLPDGRYADEPGNPLPDWFRDLPWDYPEDEIIEQAEDGDADSIYVRVNGSGRLWEMP